ncbi:hypothetical protein GF354_04885 [Candidatus Peregrinibacteria bacterium]|nr:hypothetical protein [Candidatus Peregrinibacteria bacterium]
MFKEKLFLFKNGGPERGGIGEVLSPKESKEKSKEELKRDRQSLADELAGELSEDISLETVKEGSEEHLQVQKEMKGAEEERSKERASKARKIEEEMKRLIVEGFESDSSARKTEIKKDLREKLKELNNLYIALGQPKTTLKEWNDRARANKDAWMDKYGSKKSGVSEKQREAANKILF